jgi:hypothetical protein
VSFGSTIVESWPGATLLETATAPWPVITGQQLAASGAILYKTMVSEVQYFVHCVRASQLGHTPDRRFDGNLSTLAEVGQSHSISSHIR